MSAFFLIICTAYKIDFYENIWYDENTMTFNWYDFNSYAALELL